MIRGISGDSISFLSAELDIASPVNASVNEKSIQGGLDSYPYLSKVSALDTAGSFLATELDNNNSNNNLKNNQTNNAAPSSPTHSDCSDSTNASEGRESPALYDFLSDDTAESSPPPASAPSTMFNNSAPQAAAQSANSLQQQHFYPGHNPEMNFGNTNTGQSAGQPTGTGNGNGNDNNSHHGSAFSNAASRNEMNNVFYPVLPQPNSTAQPVYPAHDQQHYDAAPSPAVATPSAHLTMNATRLRMPSSISTSPEPSDHEQKRTPSPVSRKRPASEMSNVPIDSSTIRELLHQQDLKRKRLARKAELARQSRRKKKVRLQDLEGEVHKLEDQLAAAKRAHELEREEWAKREAMYKAAADSAAQQQPGTGQPTTGEDVSTADKLDRAIEDVTELATAPASTVAEKGPTLVAGVRHALEARAAAAKLHSESVESTFQSNMPIQFLEWVMSKQDRFYQDKSGLWNSLFVNEIGLSPEKNTELLSMRASMKSDEDTAEDVQAAFGAFQQVLTKHCERSRTSFSQLCEILTPKQLAQYIKWVNNFGAVCVKINM